MAGMENQASLQNQAGETGAEERIRKKLEDLGIDPIVLSPEPKRAPGPLVLCPYSPTNGTKSLGQIMVEIHLEEESMRELARYSIQVYAARL